MNNEVLIYDTETSSLDVDEAEMKFFGAYSFKTKRYYLLDYTKSKEIIEIISNHKVLVGFNNKEYDNPILQKIGANFNYKYIIDLLEICRVVNGKSRLKALGYNLKSFTLRNITNKLDIDKIGKGNINYDIFKKDEWTNDEKNEIYKYLKKDVEVTTKLLIFLDKQFSPLKEFLPPIDRLTFKHLTTTIGSLAYRVIANKAGLGTDIWASSSTPKQSFSGGHHIQSRHEKVRGRIICADLTSAYPHAIFMNNLYSHSCTCCSDENKYQGNEWFKLSGKYCNKSQGKIETTIKKLFDLRMEAKKNNDKLKDKCLKLIINSCYGISGNQAYKYLYNINTAQDCTYIVRTILKIVAATLEANNCEVLYGFTDSVYCLLPDYITNERMQEIIDLSLTKLNVSTPFPSDSFKMLIEKEYKFIWFVESKKNRRLWVDTNNNVGYQSTIFDENTPAAIMILWDQFLAPRIRDELDVNFTKE